MASMPGATPRTRLDAPTPDRHDDDRRPGLTAASLFMVLIGFWIVTRVEATIVLGLFGLLLGTILEGPVRRLEERRIPRAAGVAMIYVAIIGALVLFVFLIIPVISDQVDTFREDIPGQLQNLEEEWRTSTNPLLNGAGADLLDTVGGFFDESEAGDDVEITPDTIQGIIPVVTTITGGIIAVVTTLVITFYYLMEKAFIRRLVIGQLDPRRQPRVDRIWQDVEHKVGGWMRGQLLLCLIIGTIATVSYGAIGITFWPLLGLWAGITEIIPIVGPWIGGVPAVIVALTQGWEKAIIVGIVIIGMQSLENWVLVPRVMRGAVGLTPLTVFVAFMGITGAILAIPIAAAIQVILSDYFASRLLKREPQQQSGWRWMLSRAARDDEAPPEAPPGPDIPDSTGTNQTISPNVVMRPHSPEDSDDAAALSEAVSLRNGGWAPFGPATSADASSSPPGGDQERRNS